MEIIKLSEANTEEAAKRAARVLEKGGIVLYPTDTLYGLGVDATNEEAIERLKDLKGRDKKKPISVIVPSVEHISAYAHMNAPAKQLAEKFFPGALTLVLPAKDTISKELTLNDSIGVRIPDDAFCLALAREFGLPFTTTSANKAGRETAKDVRHVLEQFGNHVHEISLVIDGGERRGEHPSTVVQVTGDTPYVLREGALSRAQLGV